MHQDGNRFQEKQSPCASGLHSTRVRVARSNVKKFAEKNQHISLCHIIHDFLPTLPYLVNSLHEGGHDDRKDLATSRFLGELSDVQQVDTFVCE